MAAPHGGRREALRIGRSLWAGVGLVRGGGLQTAAAATEAAIAQAGSPTVGRFGSI